MTIDGNINVGVGSTVTFSVQGDINVNGDVGVPASNSTTINLQGFYSTDHNFLVDDDNNAANPDKTNSCPAADNRLNIAGTVVTNASLTGGRLINHRDLCADNPNHPTIYFKESLDLILNAPRFLKREIRIYTPLLSNYK